MGELGLFHLAEGGGTLAVTMADSTNISLPQSIVAALVRHQNAIMVHVGARSAEALRESKLAMDARRAELEQTIADELAKAAGS